MNEWDSWKVGDVLEARRHWGGGITTGTRVTITAIGTTSTGMLFTVEGNGHKTSVGDYGKADNPGIYFFWVSPAAPERTWQVGDRVKRDAVRSEYDGVVPGVTGTVETVSETEVSVRYGGITVFYDLPMQYAYFSLVDTCTTPKQVLCCTRCNEACEYAEANQTDGTFKCWQCRTYRFR